MSASTRVMNFGSGPGALPLPALTRAQDELLDIEGSGMSILEHSHRGAVYDRVHEETRERLRRLLALPASHEVLFFQGGATQQFANVAMAFGGPGEKLGYAVTGVWGEKAAKDAAAWQAFISGAAPTVVKPERYERLLRSDELRFDPASRYVHCTSNETIHGVQWDAAVIPQQVQGIPLVCDMSSDFLSRPVDLSRYALVYAGAQKNIGPSGLCVVIVDRAFAESGSTKLPSVLRYDLAIRERSLVNTPPVFSIYLARNVLAWLEEQGGLEAIAAQNRAKAELLYGALEASGGFYRCPVEPAARSQMNVVFRLPSEELEARFLAEAKALGMVGLKGHRSVGGLRAALYNAVPSTWVAALAEFTRDFAARAG